MDTRETKLFPKGEELPKDFFVGKAYLTPLISKDKNNGFAMGNVTFEPGSRTNWHTHPKGQVLIVTGGNGLYQEEGKQAQALKKGDVVNIPEDVKHWHGASANSQFVHIAVTNYKNDKNVDWLEPVSEEDYDNVNNDSNAEL
jgi:4-carboxymuconolactone decarboxylase